MDKTTHTLVSVLQMRKKNRRVEVSCYRSDKDPNDFTFRIYTKRLVDLKSRHIQELNTVYGLESALAIRDALAMITSEPTFLKIANVAIHQATKERFKGEKYINKEDFA